MNFQQNNIMLSNSILDANSMEEIYNKNFDPSRVKLRLNLETSKLEFFSERSIIEHKHIFGDEFDIKALTLKEVVSQDSVLNVIYIPSSQLLIPDVKLDGFSIFPGSFNPLHVGHTELVERAAVELSGGKVAFELSIGNADKGFISNEELMKRIEYFKDSEFPLIINKAGLFKDKLLYIKNGYFLMGVDTFKRVFDLKYYSGKEEIEDFCESMIKRGMKIAVGGRIDEEKEFKLAQHYLERVPEYYREYVHPIEGYRVDLSSTDIRNGDALTGLEKKILKNDEEKKCCV